MAESCVANISNSCGTDKPFCNGVTCVESCGDWFHYGITKTCVEKCPNTFPFSYGQECLTACPSGFEADADKKCIRIVEKSLFNIDWDDFWTQVVKWCTSTGLRLVIAIILLIICFYIISFICKRLYNILARRNVNPTICKVGSTALKYLLRLIVLVALISYVGIETAAVSALLAAFGVAVGLALQGALANLAGGIIILVTQPFQIGDYIVSCGQEGTVEDIKLFYSYIVTVDNCLVFIPNGTLANGVIVNKSIKPTRRVDLLMSVDYKTDIELAKKVMLRVLRKHPLILKDPEPVIYTCTYASSSIDLTVRSWCNNADYWTIYWDLMDSLKAALDKKGIEIPFNQMDIHIKDTADSSAPSLPPKKKSKSHSHHLADAAKEKSHAKEEAEEKEPSDDEQMDE